MIFFIISTSILILAYVYVGFRIISPTKFPKSKKRLIWIILMLLPPLLPLSFFLRFNFTGSIWIDLVGWIAYILFGFFSFVIALLLLRDIINLLAYLIQRMRNFILRAQYKRKKPFDPQRRQFIFNSVNVGIIGASTILTGYGIYEARRKPILKHITVPINRLPKSFEGMRIAQITDLHVGPTIKRRFVQSTVEAANSLNADIIVCTGDLVDDFVDNIREDVLPIKDLFAPKGVYFVTGNHEYYVGAQPWIEEIDKFGLRVLINDHHVIENSSDKLVLAGVPDYSAAQFIREHSSDPFKALQDAPQKAIKILLAHQPRNIFSAVQARYDLQISGHTHGGQYFPWSLLVTLGQPYVRGLHKHNNTWIYVNQGTGYWGPPVRLGVPSEITLFELTGNRIS